MLLEGLFLQKEHRRLPLDCNYLSLYQYEKTSPQNNTTVDCK